MCLQVLNETGIHHLRLLHMLGRLALFMFLPLWFLSDFWKLIYDPNVVSLISSLSL
jgi:solute carrier family 35, member E1